MSDLDVRLESRKIFNKFIKENKNFYCYFVLPDGDGKKIKTNNENIKMSFSDFLKFIDFFIKIDNMFNKEFFISGVFNKIRDLYKYNFKNLKEKGELDEFLIASAKYRLIFIDKKNYFFKESYEIIDEELKNENGIFLSSFFIIFEDDFIYIDGVDFYKNIELIIENVILENHYILFEIYFVIEIKKKFKNIDEYIDSLIEKFKKNDKIIDLFKDSINPNVH